MAAPARAVAAAAQKPATPVKVVPSKSTASPAPALNAAPPAVSLSPTVAANEVDLSSGQLAIANAAEVKDGAAIDVNVRLPGLAEGSIKVRKRKEVFDSVGFGHAILLAHPVLSKLGAATVLVVRVKENVVTGYVTLGAPGAAKGKDRSVVNAIAKGADALNWLGLTNINIPTMTNDFTGGALTLSAEGMTFKVGGFLEGTGAFAINGKDLSLEGGAKIVIPGGTEGNLVIKRDPKGGLSGTASMSVKVGGVSGTVTGDLTDGFVRVMGTVAYASDKLSGSATLIATDEATARDLTLQKPSSQGGQIPQLDAESAKTNKPGKRAFCGFGELNFQINEWLAGSATVIINSKGQATIIGEIAPPKEFILFEQKDWEKRLFKVEAKAGYGIPVVGQVFVFASAELKAKASVGPGKLYNIKLSGVYSTDPRVTKEMTLEASLNISAFAGLIVRAEGGVGITILGHDIKAGVGIDATAGVRGYVEATPKIGMRKAPGQKTEYFIEGHMEIAAQPFLGLAGDLFVSVETPWWSPLSDKRWTWPLFSLEYPLPGEFGIGADVSYVLGSKKWPEISFGEVAFDASKFTTDIMSDNASKGKGGEKKKPGKWKEGAGGEAPGSKGGAGGGGAGKDKGGGGFNAPIGEKVAFSDGLAGHSLWIAEKKGDAQPMAASTPAKVVETIAGMEADIVDAATGDQAKARQLAAAAKVELKKLGTESERLAAIKEASANAKQYYDTKGKAEPKGKKGPKDDPNKLNGTIKSDEHRLAASLGELAKLTLRVPFKPLERKAAMYRGGIEPVKIAESEGHAALTVANARGTEKLDEVSGGPVQGAINKRGLLLVQKASSAVSKLGGTIGKAKIREKKINAKVNHSLPILVDKVAEAVSHIGKTMEITNLNRALKKVRIRKITKVEFSAHPKSPNGTALYKKRFLTELKRQLARQQRGLNELDVDRWLHNLMLFAMSPEIFRELDRSGRLELLAELERRAADAEQGARLRFDRASKAMSNGKKDQAEALEELQRAEERVRQVEVAQEEIERAKAEALAATTPEALANPKATPERDRLAPKDPATIGTDYETRVPLRILGRMGHERGVRDKLKRSLAKLRLTAAKRNASLETLRTSEAEWRTLAKTASDLAILHNPDQVAGGFDFDRHVLPKMPSSTDTKAWATYLKKLRQWFGPKEVNERIGQEWRNKIGDARKDVQAPNTAVEAYSINLLNFRLVPDVP